MSVYQQEERGSDSAAWLGSERDEAGERQDGIAGMMIQALRGVGLLDGIILTREGVVVWSVEP